MINRLFQNKLKRSNTAVRGFDVIIYLFLLLTGFFFSTVLILWWLSPEHIPQNFSGGAHIIDYFLFLALSYSLGYGLLYELHAWELFGYIMTPYDKKPQEGMRVAFLTAFVPGNEPYSILEKTLPAMVANYYEHDTWVLDEGNDPIVKEICKKYGVKHFSRKGIEKYNQDHGEFKAKTKGGNYNAWFDQNADQYDVVAQIDVDFIPKRNFLIKTIGHFEDPEVGFVGTPQVYGNKDDSWIATAAAEQTYGFYGPFQRALYGKGMTLFIGANHIVRVAAHKDIGGYAGHITEDHLTGMKYYSKHWKSVYVPEALAIGEGPTTWESYFNQQMRWAYGSIDILFREGHKLFGKGRMSLRQFLRFCLLEHFYFGGLAQAIGLVLLLLYFFLGMNPSNIGPEFFYFYLPVFAIQIAFFLWSQRFYVDPKSEFGLGLKGKFLYIAAWPIFLIAFFSALFKKRLTYKVTPKGDDQPGVNLSMFIPHFVLGTCTLVCMLLAAQLHRDSAVLIGFAFTNTVFMYSFVGLAIAEKIRQMVSPSSAYSQS